MDGVRTQVITTVRGPRNVWTSYQDTGRHQLSPIYMNLHGKILLDKES